MFRCYSCFSAQFFSSSFPHKMIWRKKNTYLSKNFFSAFYCSHRDICKYFVASFSLKLQIINIQPNVEHSESFLIPFNVTFSKMFGTQKTYILVSQSFSIFCCYSVHFFKKFFMCSECGFVAKRVECSNLFINVLFVLLGCSNSAPDPFKTDHFNMRTRVDKRRRFFFFLSFVFQCFCTNMTSSDAPETNMLSI